MNPDEYPQGDWDYIGDGVYARWDGYGAWCATHRENGWHSIYFEPGMIDTIRNLLIRPSAKAPSTNGASHDQGFHHRSV